MPPGRGARRDISDPDVHHVVWDLEQIRFEKVCTLYRLLLRSDELRDAFNDRSEPRWRWLRALRTARARGSPKDPPDLLTNLTANPNFNSEKVAASPLRICRKLQPTKWPWPLDVWRHDQLFALIAGGAFHEAPAPFAG
jgi:hypothetical protein